MNYREKQAVCGAKNCPLDTGWVWEKLNLSRKHPLQQQHGSDRPTTQNELSGSRSGHSWVLLWAAHVSSVHHHKLLTAERDLMWSKSGLRARAGLMCERIIV
eukprot:scaffold133364_cov69-Cyclotella_meneghiniana.AAC.6